MKLFISHSSKDEQFVRHLVSLLQFALSLPSAEIRCTSLDGYRLPGGAHIEDQVRAEVLNSEILIGVISSASVESMYVVFELGARWGSQKQLIPLLAPGAPSSLLKGPLLSLNALRADARAQLHQFVDDVSSLLKTNVQPPAAYLSYIESILSIKSRPPDQSMREEVDTGGKDWPTSKSFLTLQAKLSRLSESNKKILLAVAKSGNGIYVMHLANQIPMDRSELVYRGKDLANQELIEIEHLTDFSYRLHPFVKAILGNKASQLILAMVER